MPLPLPALAHHALAVYAESLVVGRRVVVLGGDESFGERLADLGADEVLLVASTAEAASVRASSFDVALAPDLGLLDDPQTLVAEVRRIVGADGVALFAAANRDVVRGPDGRAFEYYELFDLVAGAFADVRMIAQVPFHGVALAELGNDDEAPAVSVDTQLVEEAQAPVAFVALASERGASLEPYAIYELPSEAPPQVDVGELLAPLQAELARERLRAEALSGQLDALRPQIARATELEREAVARHRSFEDLALEVEGMRAAAAASAEVASRVEALARRAEEAELGLARAAAAAAVVQPSAEAHAEEVSRLEAHLEERGAMVRALEQEVERRDRIVRDLVATLEESVGPAPDASSTTEEWIEDNAQLRARLDAMALELARREGEAQAAGWRLAELERRKGTAAPSDDLRERLHAAMDEVDALRHALTQEHDQRLQAEKALRRPGSVDAEPSV